uniref:MPL proto-onco, thrombopoietin receptor n=1 Tax=Crocodylus porosus TaxID=8502 RepID=A0A7M4FH30_CROPO
MWGPCRTHWEIWLSHQTTNSCALCPADAALLPEVPKSIRCFSRSFEDFTCFWDEREMDPAPAPWGSPPDLNPCREGARECMLATQRLQDGGRRYICVFPSQDVRLFTELCLRVVDVADNCTVRIRTLSVEDMGESTRCPHPNASTPRPCPHPPYPSMPPSSPTRSDPAPQAPGSQLEVVVSRTACNLTLRPGQTYRIQMRTKPDGLSLNGTWGPWSPALCVWPVELGLRCSTPDLQCVHCEWTPAPADANGSHTLFYQPHESPGSPRAEAWQHCQGGAGTGPQGAHACTFWLGNASARTVVVKVTRDAQPSGHRANVSAGRLRLQWAAPLAKLAQHMVYQVRYATDSSQDWKVPGTGLLNLRAGSRYHLQVRAQPNGQQFGGYWSAWSETVVVQAPLEAGEVWGTCWGCARGAVGRQGCRAGRFMVPLSAQAGSSQASLRCRSSSWGWCWCCGAPSPPCTGNHPHMHEPAAGSAPLGTAHGLQTL